MTERSNAEVSDASGISIGVRSLTIQNLGTLLLGFVLLGVMLRELPAEQYGIYSAIFVCYTIASGTIPFNITAARFLATMKDSDELRAWRIARGIFILSILYSAAASSVFLYLSPFLSLYFTKSSAWTFSFELGALWIFLGSLSLALQGYVQGLRKYQTIARMLLMSRLAMVAFTVGTLYLYDNVDIVLLGWIFFSSLVVSWSLFATGRRLFQTKAGYEYGQILRYSLPLVVAGTVNVIANYGDQFIVGGYLNSVALGIYNATVTISNAIALVLYTPLQVMLLPEISSRLRNSEQVTVGLRVANRFIFLAILPISFIVAGLSIQLLQLFSGGGVYLTGVISLQTLSVLLIFTPMQGVITSLLQAIGRTQAVMVVNTASIFIVIIFSILLVPVFGIEGAAVSNSLVSVVGFALALYYFRNHFRKKDFLFYSEVLAGSSLVLVTILVLTSLVSHNTITLIPYAIIGATIFLSWLKATRILNVEDKEFLSRFLPSFVTRLLEHI